VIWLGILLLFVLGVFFSAFFSGSETGFYRVTRVRLALDSRGGDLVARGLLWMTNNPTFFVASSLIGNNIANYVASLAVVLGTRRLLGGEPHTFELLATIMMAPVVFVYGELLPKHLFYLAPNQLLRRGGPLFLVCTILFIPVSFVLWVLGRLLQWLVGEAPEYVRSRLAREELQRILDEGQEAGLLRPAQRQLAQGMFAVANQSVRRFVTPMGRTTGVRRSTTREEVLRIARRQRSPIVLVQPEQDRHPIGYVRIIDLLLSAEEWTTRIRPLLRVGDSDPHLATLIQMQTEEELVAEVVDQQGTTVGILSLRRLTEPLLRD
jgi:CBS domain containing-hemolysin-like protein